VSERRQDEHRQRARRVLEPEVSVRDGAVGDRVAVARVRAGVAELPAREKAVVDGRPAAEEEAERDGDECGARDQKGPRGS
jgi:hypothetical protein